MPKRLHQVIVEIVEKYKEPISVRKITDIISKNRLWLRPSDNKLPDATQVSARVHNYSKVFKLTPDGVILLRKKRQTAQVASPNLLKGTKFYLQKARETLPYLVRLAKAEHSIYYSELSQVIGIPNPRNFNYILGAIGNALINLGQELDIDTPPIQCLVINKRTKMPGEGVDWFITKSEFKKLTSTQKAIILKQVLAKIYSFQKWDWILEQLQLQPLSFDIKSEIEKAKRIRGKGGESPYHFAFKNFIAANPQAIGLPKHLNDGKVEYPLPSADTIDIVFTDKNKIIGVEAKSRISDKADILRGLFQCIKYKYLIEAEQIINNRLPDSRVILALEGQIPSDLIAIKNILGIEVMEKIKITP